MIRSTIVILAMIAAYVLAAVAAWAAVGAQFAPDWTVVASDLELFTGVAAGMVASGLIGVASARI
jgi:hypothetical protein